MSTAFSRDPQPFAITSLPIICGVYCITHKDTGKKYVGQSIDCIRRMLEHCRWEKTDLGRAIRKLGREAFTFEILEQAPRTELLERESKWIAKLNTKAPNGFNRTSPTIVRNFTVEERRAFWAKKTRDYRAKNPLRQGVFA